MNTTKMSQLPWTANGSETSTATWVEDAHGKRVCTMIKGEQDWRNAQAIAEAVNQHGRLLGLVRAVFAAEDAVLRAKVGATVANSKPAIAEREAARVARQALRGAIEQVVASAT